MSYLHRCVESQGKTETDMRHAARYYSTTELALVLEDEED